MLKRLYGLLLASVLIPTAAWAQGDPMSSKEMVAITPVVCEGAELPADADRALMMKMNQMVTANGMGASSLRYALVPNVVVVDKQTTGTVPVQFIVSLEVSFYVLDVTEEIIVAETSFTTRGIDRLENKAIIRAINQIASRSPQVKTFMEKSRSKIIDYYTTRVPALLQKAQSLADREQYNEAIALLSAVPESIDEYPLVAEQMSAIYKKSLDQTAVGAIRQAKGAIALKNYDEAFEALQKVNPLSSYSDEAFALIESVDQQLAEEERQQKEEEMRRYEERLRQNEQARQDAVALQQLQLATAREAASTVSGGGNSESAADMAESFNDKVNKWFLSKFK